ncbi:type II secretion system F family protein [Fretibacter rubidus]|uniref:type II secretion system F family protein n=1 Tax=Fretibacter rubidus TaxID=570162 RepID=UPI00352A64F3
MDQALILPAALAAMVVLLGFMFLSGGDNSSKKRVAAISSASGTKAGKSMFGFLKSEEGGSRRKQIEESLGKIEEVQKDKKKRIKSLESRLIQANWKMKKQGFMIMCVILAVIAGGVPFSMGADWKLCAGAALVVGFGLPRWWMGLIITRRQKKFIAHFSDAMDIIVRGVRTGLPLGDCLKIIAHESPEPVRTEFQLLVEGESVGVPIEVCLERMYDRMPLSEVNFFATVLNIQRSTGGNLGESLANLSNVLRARKMMREKIKALAAEAKMSGIIIGSLPIVVMALISVASPDYMTELYTTSTGHRNLMIGAVMMVVGTLVMKKMINFKF